MAQPYVGEIRMFAGTFAPVGWMFCEGQYLPITEYETLFQLIGTTFGGDGVTSFALPDLRGRVPLHQGTNDGYTFIHAETGGAEEVTLTVAQMPAHNHIVEIGKNATEANPQGHILGSQTTLDLYRLNPEPNHNMAVSALDSTGGSQPHNNMQPYLCIHFIISLFGIFPSQT